MASTARKMKIARPVARKSSGKSKPKSGSTPKTETHTHPVQAVEPANPRRRMVELPKVAGELPTPVATFYF